jgi:hypothetical protein
VIYAFSFSFKTRCDNEPPTGSGDGSLLPADDYYNNIFILPTISHHDATLNHLKPTLSKALPHWPHASVTPLEASAGELLSGDGFGIMSSRDFDVIGSFTKGLVVRFLL